MVEGEPAQVARVAWFELHICHEQLHDRLRTHDFVGGAVLDASRDSDKVVVALSVHEHEVVLPFRRDHLRSNLGMLGEVLQLLKLRLQSISRLTFWELMVHKDVATHNLVQRCELDMVNVKSEVGRQLGLLLQGGGLWARTCAKGIQRHRVVVVLKLHEGIPLMVREVHLVLGLQLLALLLLAVA